MHKQLSERELIEGILSDPTITEAVTHLYCAMCEVKTERMRNGQEKAPFNSLYEIYIEARKVSTQTRTHRFYTVMYQPQPEAAA